MSLRRETRGGNIWIWRRNVSPYQVIEEHALCGSTVCSPKGGFDLIKTVDTVANKNAGSSQISDR